MNRIFLAALALACALLTIFIPIAAMAAEVATAGDTAVGPVGGRDL